jgi:phosphoglucosamine mutase
VTLWFGTDGVRGLANRDLLPADLVALGRVAAEVLEAGTVVVGRDTRRSGPMLEAALVAGFASAGASVVTLGVAPTPVVAHWANRNGWVGAVVSASHNPAADNGVKLFAAGGLKLTDEQQQQIEHRLADGDRDSGDLPTGAGVGTIEAEEDPFDEYVEHLGVAIEDRTLEGLTIAIDCAHGAASPVAAIALGALGAEVVVVGDRPDGLNINDGVGSNHPEQVAELTVANRCHLGVAFDGDADRLVAVDERGAVIDGDRLLALFAPDLARRGRLPRDTVVVTVMSNLGLRQALARKGIAVVETPVGDRFVLEALASGGYALGGEQSGHLVFSDLATTGDGLMSAVLLADLLRRSGGPLSALAGPAMRRLPQVLVNVEVAPPADRAVEDIAHLVRAEQRVLGDQGRILVRSSGTEPLVRVMVEAPSVELAEAVAEHLAGEVARRAGRHPSR